MLEIHTKLTDNNISDFDDKVSMSFDLRQKSRIRVKLASGREAAIFMTRGEILRGGDVLQAQDGSIIQVQAADQQVMIVTTHSAHALMRAAYHLGNRHVPLEIGDGWLKLEADYVLKDMLLGLHVNVEETQAPFEPEAGAYGGGHHHHHDDHDHDHEHSHHHHH
ncbi:MULTISPECIES: urease accessory protein UreE [Methylophaga]|jgi:urease accessory protein|uniref:Urease accessory protein UreE n=1 Tax=Methylophaga thalassica TaxID=40223 RepID=A0ABQ5TS07_9GAMM|nr:MULTISPECIES: urease accessory protein UreE [Methylophaga]WVI86712.1 urease accessory protein UreE [Methylophaga thalassica]GLP98984.1 urease accessory protein UreE [Methylophaga thalassica]